MLRSRIVPCLLLSNGGIVKTLRFGDAKYIGDPLNAVRIFNEKEVDELIVLDIDATVQGREPDYKLIASLARECRMPLCYGGGIKSIAQIEHLVSLGVEKIAISSAAVLTPKLISEAARRVGRQSIVVVLDVKKSGLINKKYTLFIRNGSQNLNTDPVEFATVAEEYGAGEIVINSIDRDGMMQGYDFDLIDSIRSAVTIPLTALGGAGDLAHLSKLIKRFGIIGAAAGSLFVFKGKYRAVLIQYPNSEEAEMIARGVYENRN